MFRTTDKRNTKLYNMFDNQFVNIPKYKINGYDNHYFCTNKKLHNIKSKRILKKRVKCSSVGYELNGKFITLKKLRSMLIKINKLSKNL